MEKEAELLLMISVSCDNRCRACSLIEDGDPHLNAPADPGDVGGPEGPGEAQEEVLLWRGEPQEDPVWRGLRQGEPAWRGLCQGEPFWRGEPQEESVWRGETQEEPVWSGEHVWRGEPFWSRVSQEEPVRSGVPQREPFWRGVPQEEPVWSGEPLEWSATHRLCPTAHVFLHSTSRLLLLCLKAAYY